MSETFTCWLVADCVYGVSAKEHGSLASARSEIASEYDEAGKNAFDPAIFRLEHTEDGWKATQEPLQPEPVYWVGWSGAQAKYRLIPETQVFSADTLIYVENDKGGLDLLSEVERDKVIAEFKARQS